MIFLFCDFAPVPLERPLTIAAAWKRARILAAATSVCSRFHAVLSSASEFWNVIIFTPLGRNHDADVLKRMIQRSGERPVQVVWDCKGTRVVASNACVEALCSVKTTRIHALSIRLTCKGTPLTAGVFEHRLGTLSLLRGTRVECHDECSKIPFIPSGASTTMLTIASNRAITNFERHVEVNLPARLATTLVSLRLEVFIRTRDLNDYLSHCTALQHLQWVTPALPLQFPLDVQAALLEEEDHQPILSLPKTVTTVVIAHPILLPVLHAPSLTYARLDVHDHDQVLATNWEDWNIQTPHIPRLKSLWISCTCIATNGMLEAIVNSAARELEKVNLGVQKRFPKGVLYAINTLRRYHTPRLHSISFGIWPHSQFDLLWEKAAERLEMLLMERDSLRVHCVCINQRLPKPIRDLYQNTEDRIVLHSVPDLTCFYKTIRGI